MEEFNKLIQAQLNKMCATGKLFRSSLTGDQAWHLYLKSFRQDPIFRDPESSIHNCNLCKNFIRRYGNIVAFDEDYNIITIFDVEAEEEFVPVAKALHNALFTAKVSEVFFETFLELNSLPYESCNKNNSVFQLGVASNVKRYTKEEAEKFGVVQPNEIRKFTHMHLSLPKQFVDQSGKSVEQLMATYRDAKNVFQKGMEVISVDTFELVKDLINQGSLLDGQAHLYKIEQILPLKKKYDALSASQKENWCWVESYNLPFAKFKNELIGALCTELAEGKALNDACQAWNKRVDPANYMKVTAPITAKQIAEAKSFVEDNGYVESFNRRMATIEDIKASEILHMNVGEGKIAAVSIFDGVKSTSTRHKRAEFDKVEEVTIEKFMADILPTCTSVEAFLTNQHTGNLVTLTTANDKASKPIFKWNNNYSWTFNGNLAGKSMIKEAVKDRGGKTEGVVNIRLAFPNTTSDYDLHVVEPAGDHIYYSNRRIPRKSSGMLDLDAQGVDGNFPPEKRVENVIYTDQSKMPSGSYRVFVNNFSKRDANFGFTVEIEVKGETTTFNYNKILNGGDNVDVCKIEYKNNEFSVQPILPVSESNSISKEVYGLETNQFHKVNLVCLSPNHWNENSVGNKHYMFMLEGCKCPDEVRGFHNENLTSELLQHKRVLEVLGTKAMIPSTEKQLSGLGFNATVRDELVVRLQGSFKRVIKIKF